MLWDVIHTRRSFMHYILKKSRPSPKKGLYLQIYINDYISGKGKVQRCHKSLGYFDDLVSPSCPDPIAFYSEEVKRLNLEHQANIVKQIGDVVPTKNIGYFLLKIMFDKLKLDRDIKFANSNKNFQFDLADFIKSMVYAQVIDPGSKYKAFEKVLPALFGINAFSYDQIRDGIKYIGEDYESFIEILNHRINEIWKRKIGTAFFDCTNYYFEIDQEIEDRKKGHSKENRRDPIISQALLLDEDQIPLAMSMFPGNDAEMPYLRNHIEDLKSRYNITNKIVQVADKGLNCARNIYAAVKEANDGYIFSKSVHGHKLSEIEKKWVLLENDSNVWFEVKDNDDKIIYKYKETIDDFSYKFKDENDKEIEFKVKEKRVVTYNPSLARKKKIEIMKEIEKAKSLSLKGAFKNEYGDSMKYVIFISSNDNGEKVEIFSSLNQKKIDEDLSLAGYNLLVTSEINKSARDIYNAYHCLWRIEESFRIMKTYLEARPVFLQTKESIYGHFLVCYYALTILRLLEIKVFNDVLPVSSIINFIRDFNVTEYAPNLFINNMHAGYVKKAIKSSLGISQITNLYLSKKDIDSIINASLD